MEQAVKAERTIPQIIQDVGFDFSWSVEKVWKLAMPVEDLAITELTWHFDIPFWESEGTDEYNLKPSTVMSQPEREPTHWKLIQHADTSYPIDIMQNKGRWLILDGLHRLVKLSLEGKTSVRVRKIPRDKIPEILE